MSTAMPFAADETLLSDVTAAVGTAGVALRDRHLHARGLSLDEIVEEIHANDDAVLDVLREPLLRARQGSQWAEDELVEAARSRPGNGGSSTPPRATSTTSTAWRTGP